MAKDYIILTKRFFQHTTYWQQVYEWEDIIKEGLSASFYPNFSLKPMGKLMKLFNKFPLVPQNKSLLFEMNPEWRWVNFYNRSNIIPWIIDFYLSTDEMLEQFYRNFSKHQVVMISSIEAYNYLKSKNCPLPIVHMPLSLSDKFRINKDTSFKKEFDVLLMGRTNKVLLSYLEKYMISHPELNVVSCKVENGHFNYYNRNGIYYGNADKRADIIELLKKSRIGLYTEKGIVGDTKQGARTEGFCHVTPRLFEYMMTGNHIIAQYVDNAESDYFELKSLTPNIDKYEKFKLQMDFYLATDVDMEMYSNYLDKHYTSTLLKPIKELLDSIV